jgi:hypothetical protein
MQMLKIRHKLTTLCASLLIIFGLAGGVLPGVVMHAAACDPQDVGNPQICPEGSAVTPCADGDIKCYKATCTAVPNGNQCLKYKCTVDPNLQACQDILNPGGSSGSSSGSSNLVNQAKCDPTDQTKCVVAPCSNDNPNKPKSCDLSDCTNSNCNLFIRYLNPLVNVLAIGAGLAAVIGIIYGGIEYAASGGDPQQAASGKRHVKIAIIAIVAYVFVLAGLRFLIPGSVSIFGVIR